LADTYQQFVCVQDQKKLNDKVIKSKFFTTNSPSTHQTFSQIYQVLFTPTVDLQNYINNAITSIDLHPRSVYLATQIRSNYPLQSQKGLVRPSIKSHPELIKSWAINAVQSVIDTYREFNEGKNSSEIVKNPPVYVTSDNPDIVKFLKSLNEEKNNTNDDNIINKDGEEDVDWPVIIGLEHMLRRNIEFLSSNRASDMFPAFLDYWLMAHSQCMSYGIGGFGKFGADLAGTGCMIQHRSSKKWGDYEKE